MATPSPVEKNIIFVTGNPHGNYKELAEEITRQLYKSVYLAQPNPSIRHYQSLKDLATENSLFFSQVLFYGSLPSRQHVVVGIPDLNMKTILQFMILFEKINKNVFVVVDDRCFVSAFSKDKYKMLFERLPKGCGIFFSPFGKNEMEPLCKSVERLIDKLAFNSYHTTAETLNCFNHIMDSIPELFREEIRKSVYGSDFGDIPFNRLVKNLLPDFDDAEIDDLSEELVQLKIPRKTIPDYFTPIKKPKDSTTPPTLDIQESEGEFISLFEEFPDGDKPFDPPKSNN